MPDGVAGAVGMETLGVLSVSLGTLDPGVVFDAPAAVRAAVSFLVTVLLGGAIIYRYGGRVDVAARATRESPLLSVVYGLGAFGFVVFVVAFGLSELSRIGIGLRLVSVLVSVALLAMVLSLGAVGFGIVGALLADVVGVRDPMFGLVGAAGASAAVWFALPFVVGALVWLLIAAVGIGGSTRRWVHQSPVEGVEAGGQD